MYLLKKTKYEELTHLKTLSTQKHIGKNLNPKSLEKFKIGLYEKLGYVRYNIGVENHREVWFYKKLK